LGDKLARGDYLRLVEKDLITLAALQAASDDSILICIDKSQAKLKIVRAAIKHWKPIVVAAGQAAVPILPRYEP
jgi:hypothetical protein